MVATRLGGPAGSDGGQASTFAILESIQNTSKKVLAKFAFWSDAEESKKRTVRMWRRRELTETRAIFTTESAMKVSPLTGKLRTLSVARCPRNELTFSTSRHRSTVFNSSFNENHQPRDQTSDLLDRKRHCRRRHHRSRAKVRASSVLHRLTIYEAKEG
jgi:hypothetical protein